MEIRIEQVVRNVTDNTITINEITYALGKQSKRVNCIIHSANHPSGIRQKQERNRMPFFETMKGLRHIVRDSHQPDTTIDEKLEVLRKTTYFSGASGRKGLRIKKK